MPLDQIYMTSNSINTPEYREERKPAVENFTVQMEVNIAKINKNPANAKINLNQTNIVQAPAQSSPLKNLNENEVKQEQKPKEDLPNNNVKIFLILQEKINKSYIANLLDDQSNIIQVIDYSENYTSDIEQTENSVYSQENEGDHNSNNSNNYASGNIVYTSNNYDSLRNYQPRMTNRYESEENNYNSIRGENYSSSVSGIFKH